MVDLEEVLKTDDILIEKLRAENDSMKEIIFILQGCHAGQGGWISELILALVDLTDGQSWYDIRAQTGLSEHRCKQLVTLSDKCRKLIEKRIG